MPLAGFFYSVVSTHAYLYVLTHVERGRIFLENPWGHLHPRPVPLREFLKIFSPWIVGEWRSPDGGG